MTNALFITGTDTGVGKTLVTAAMLRLLRRLEVRAVGLKPVASGSEPERPGGPLRNLDALELQSAAPLSLSYDDVNPYCFEPPIAPHIAAQESGVAVTLDALLAWYGRVSIGAEVALVEGAGGWRVPLHPAGFLSDFPEALGMGVVLVVGLKLGCLNHARLTAEAIRASGRCELAGWVANALDPGFERAEANVATLERLLGSPPLARVAWLRDGARSPHGQIMGKLDDAAALETMLLGLRNSPPARRG